jgi:hypothetical protein
MRKLTLALAGAALLALGCDPTQKHDFHCTAQVQSQSACSQLHVTDAEALVADPVCTGKDGSWGSGGCPTDVDGHARVPGYCSVDGSGYSVSGTDVSVFFYDPATAELAAAACTSEGGTWYP